MCGIVGKLNRDGAAVERGLLEKMNECLRHRGPDEGGVWTDGPVGLAMRRLKIIDLTSGQQPMDNGHCPHASKSGPLRLVYNGEIYGFGELRRELESRGHKFHSTSDTETILHAYEEFGEDFLEHLNGMFAIALYVERDETLILARDRMGIKPLYYRHTPKSFSFASEIKALLADPETSREWNSRSLDEFFSLRYVPTPRSAFKEIQKLEPGHCLKLRRGQIEKKSFWHFNPAPPVNRPIGYYLEKLDALLKNAISTHLVSDVPLGIFLSGGLDSTTLAAYVKDAGRHLDSFTIYFDDAAFSERNEAAAVAKMYELNHNERAVHPDLRALTEKLASIYDEPFADPSIIPTYYLCQFAREKVTVTLSGDGGDELFGGYPTYIADRVAAYYRHFPSLVQKMLRQAAQMLPVSHQGISFDYRLKTFLRAASRPQPRAHFGWHEMMLPEEKPQLYTEDFWRKVQPSAPEESFVRAFDEASARADLERMLFVDQRTHLLDEYLVKVDRLSMAHSLEVRVPFLDRGMVEFAAEIPAAYKIAGFNTKYIIRRLMKGRLPDAVLHGKKKGFTPPLGKWLIEDVRDWAEERLSPERVARTRILNPEEPRRLLQEHVARRKDNFRRLWTILSFMQWYEKWCG